MRDMKTFLDFVQTNNPPALPGDCLYGIMGNGKIYKSKQVKEIMLDENWEWKLVSQEGHVIKESAPYLLSAEEALQRRNNMKIKYVICQRTYGHGDFYKNNIRLMEFYNVESAHVLDVSKIPADENFITEILKKHRETIREETVIVIIDEERKYDQETAFEVVNPQNCEYHMCAFTSYGTDCYKHLQEAFNK